MKRYIQSVACLIVVGVTSAGCQHEAATAPKATGPKVVPVTTAPSERRVIESTIELVGTLKGWEDVKVGAEKSGRIVKVLHDVGDRVKPGEPLVELETINADLAIRQAEQRLISDLAKLGLKEFPTAEFDVTRLPSVVQAQVAVDKAEEKFSQELRLAEKKVNTVESMRDAKFDLQDKKAALDNALLTARANLAMAMATRVDLDVAKQARDDLVVYAPEPSKLPPNLRDGVEYAVTKRTVSEGQMIREGEQVLQLVIDNPLRMWVNVPERYSPDATTGQEVRLSVASHPGRTFLGTVTWINPSVDTESRTFQVEVAVPNDDRALRPGGFVKAAVVTSTTSERTVVPVEAIVQFAGVTKLFLAQQDKAFSVPVETGIEGSGWVEVRGEIPDGSHVIVSGQTQLADGTPISIRKPEDAPTAEAARVPSSDHERKPGDVTSG